MELRWDEAGIAAIIARCDAAGRQVTEAVKVDAVLGCPVDSGELRRSIRDEYPEPNVGRVYVGTDHWAPTEYGSRPHVIRARKPGGVLRFFWEREDRWFFGPKVNHPGTPAQPFMRPAIWRRRTIPGLP